MYHLRDDNYNDGAGPMNITVVLDFLYHCISLQPSVSGISLLSFFFLLLEYFLYYPLFLPSFFNYHSSDATRLVQYKSSINMRDSLP